jgi:hypothetical protein
MRIRFCTSSAELSPDLRAQQSPRIEIGQQMLHGQQGMDFLCRKPEPRQFELGPNAFLGIFISIPPEDPVKHDGRMQPILHIGQIPL